MSDSILNSTKKNLGIGADYLAFDQDIIMYINSVFSTLTQLGVGPVGGFEIEDATPTWEAYLNGKPSMNFIKTYMYLRVRLLFDPPATSFLITALEKQKEELEWRISVQRELGSTMLLGGHQKITGNLGDVHQIELTNPVGETLISATGTYEAEFVPRDGRAGSSAVLDTSQIASGRLYLTVTIQNGTYTVRRVEPRRTILVIDVSAQ